MKKLRNGVLLACVLFAASGNAFAAEWFVATNGNDAADGASWATAKKTIQAGVDAAASNDTVWVSNGVYATGGGRAVVGTRANRVSIDRAITVRSVNGPEETIIVGGGMRCAYVTNGATLAGFTVTNGTTASGCDPYDPDGHTSDHNGGGVLGADSGVLTNCVLTGNHACYAGGGSSGGMLYDCTLTGNDSDNLGGGSSGGTLNRCVLSGNHANMLGGGAEGGTLNSCLLTGNSASYGAGAGSGTLNNCTVANNSGWDGGGVLWSTLANCIVYWNSGDGDYCNHKDCTIVYSCTTPLPAGVGNVGDEPRFGTGYRLQSISPCIDQGSNACVQGTTDLDGNRRISNGTVDMGAFEVQSPLDIWPASTNLFAEATSGLAIEVAANVSWTATTNAPWLAITSGASGTTNGSVIYDVASNGLATARTGAVLVAGGGLVRTCAVIQAAAGPFLVLGPERFVLSGEAATGLVLAVTANVSWTATTNVPWLTIAAGASGASNGTAVFAVASNESAEPRSGAIQVAGGGIARTCSVLQAENSAFAADWHVATNGDDACDGRTWTTAKRTIQAGIDAATNGGTVWASNGTYVGLASIDKGIAVRSVNGPEVTTIQGSSSRCVNLSNAAAVVSGFTLTGGTADWGGGAYIVSGALEDCVIRNNTADGRETWEQEKAYGGGVYGGTLRRCIVACNLATAFGSEYYRPLAQGGGAYNANLYDCLVVSNEANSRFGLLAEDVTAGGGVSGGTIVNCTLVGNVASVIYAPASGALTGAGCYGSAARNSIVYGNYCFDGWDEIGEVWLGWHWDEISGGDVRYSCSPFLSTDNGNRTNVPQFVDAGTGDYRLEAESPCIDAGDNAYVIGTTDLDGRPRIVNGTVDMGAFEYQPELEISPTSTNLSHEAASGLSFEVRARVPWTATTNVPWLTITAGASGTTNGTVVFDVAANEGTALRAGTIAVAGGGSVCSYTVMQSHEGQSSNGYYAWAAGITNGLTNATDCAAGDGVPNLLRYAAGCPDPMAPDDLPRLILGANGLPSLIFNRNPDAADLFWIVQGADAISNGAAWRGVATNVGGSWLGAANVSESGSGNPVVCTVTDPVALESNRFLRLNVTRP